MYNFSSSSYLYQTKKCISRRCLLFADDKCTTVQTIQSSFLTNNKYNTSRLLGPVNLTCYPCANFLQNPPRGSRMHHKPPSRAAPSRLKMSLINSENFYFRKLTLFARRHCPLAPNCSVALQLHFVTCCFSFDFSCFLFHR